jgi:hypothetical protein
MYYSRSDAKCAAYEIQQDTRENQSHTISCNYCKEEGHIKRYCPSLKLKAEREKKRAQEEENKKKKFEDDFPILISCNNSGTKIDRELNYKV